MKDKIRDLREKYFQIDDEYLNGYAKLCGINATGVYLSLCRHANKQQQCFPSKKLIASELAISERSVYSALKELEKWNIIGIEGQGRKDDGSFKSKIYTLWDKKMWVNKPQANGAVGKKQHSPQANDDITRRQQVPNKETHINQTHINQAMPALQEEKPNINKFIELFKEVNPSYERLYSNKSQRAAVDRLIKKHGEEKLRGMIEILPKINKIPYTPITTTPYDLETNLGKILAKIEQLKTKADKQKEKIAIIQ